MTASKPKRQSPAGQAPATRKAKAAPDAAPRRPLQRPGRPPCPPRARTGEARDPGGAKAPRDPAERRWGWRADNSGGPDDGDGNARTASRRGGPPGPPPSPRSSPALAGCGPASRRRARSRGCARRGARGLEAVRLPSSGATLAYPPGWHAIHTDAGTASVALQRRDTGSSATSTPPRDRARRPSPAGRASAPATSARRGHGRSGPPPGPPGCASAPGSARASSTTTATPRRATARSRAWSRGARATTVVVGAAPAALWARQARVDPAGDRQLHDVPDGNRPPVWASSKPAL